MSFFFNKAKQQPKKVAAPKTTVASKETLNRLGCQACPLNRADNATPKMEPVIPEETDIYVLGEQPTEADDDKGVPFSDDYGKMVTGILRDHSRVAFDNVIRDFDSTGKATPWIAMECCRSRITASVNRAKPRFIVGLGILPLQWMLGSADMVGLRGRTFAVQVGGHRCYFMPTYHPAFVTQTAYDKKAPLKSKLGHCLKFDLLKVQRLAKKLPPPVIDAASDVRAAIQAFNGRGGSQLAAILRLISEACKAPVKAIDLETSHLRPYSAGARILTVAISYDDTNFAFALNHPTAGWRPADIRALTDGLADLLLSKGTIVAHNTPFECEWLISLLGTDIINHEAWECTMMQAHFLDERRGKRGGSDEQFQPNPYQSLDFLVRQHFGISYKPLFKLDRKRMVDANLDETLLYNAADTKYTLRLYQRQSYLLKEAGLWEAYKEAVPRQPTVALMQSFGICIDQNQTTQMQKKLGEEIKQIEAEIADLYEVRKFYDLQRRKFNPASNHDLLKIFKDYIKVGKALIGANGKETTDKGALAKIAHPLAKLVDDHRNRSKLKSTYVDVFSQAGGGQFIYPDGRIHPSFNTTFAETGRTSCVHGNTEIRTRDGIKRARAISINDYVWTHKGRWRKVIALWRKGVQPMYSVCLSNGQVLTCTKDHRVLCDDNSWRSIGEIDGIFQEVGEQSRKHSSSPGIVPFKENALSGSDCPTIENHKFKYLVGDKKLFEQGGIQNLEDVEVFCLEAGCEEPNERVSWGDVPSLERHLQRWLRLPNPEKERQAPICASLGDDGGLEFEGGAQGVGSPSYRWGQKEQQLRQSSTCYEKWAFKYSLASAEKQQDIAIEKIETSGSSEVFDLTIEDDGSYEACGVYHHNSDSPNQQNWPSRRDNYVRRQVTAPKSHLLLAFDYGQLEACTAAMCTRDKVLVKALWEDYDIHMEWAEKAARIYPAFIGGLENLTDKDDMKKFRSLIKNKLVFPAMFGASNKSVASYLNAPQEKIDKLMDEFWRTFTGLASWQRRLMDDYYNNGYVESPTGRRRHYPLTKNQAVNYPIQSVACDIVCRAMVALSRHALDSGKYYLHPTMNIHDDLTFSVPDDDDILEETIKIIYGTMLTPGYDFINVPLSVSCSVGKNWLQMTELGKYWSHKDL